MNTKASSFIRFLVVSICLLWFLTGCAPQEGGGPDIKKTPEAEPVVTPDPGQVVVPTATPVEVVVQPTPVPKETFDPKKPDWNLRYEMLREHYLEEFTPQDMIGKTIKIPLASGGEQAGTIVAVYEDSLDLEFENGAMNLHADVMRKDAQMFFFKQYYANWKAADQARAEYAKWQEMIAKANAPKATPTPYRQVVQQPIIPRTMPEQRPDGLPSGYRPDPGAKPPKNDPPNGRVWQVDQYLRQNSAVPHSLRYKNWGKIQKHGKGYKVRVQYSVESAGGLGTSNEDMMFFMYSDGKVYQRAAVK